jgi:hypothetical protein
MNRTLLVLALVGMMLALSASPALAQEDQQAQTSPPDPGPQTVTATGVLGAPFTRGEDPTPNYPLTDEATGTTYTLISGFVNLQDFVGQRVTITGVRVPGIDPLALNVTQIQPAPGPGGQVITATGVIETAPPHAPDPTPIYAITDETTGARYELISGFVNLGQYVGQRVFIRAVPVPGPGDPNRPPLLNVTEVVPLDTTPPPEVCIAVFPPPPGCPGTTPPPPPPPPGGGDGTTPPPAPPAQGGAAAAAPGGGVTLPSTGGPSLFWVPIVALALGSGILVAAGAAALRRSR